jgi:cell division septum initiation protein DivIVA
MPRKKLEQFHQENSTWLRTLDFMEQENAYMKNRLSKVLDGYINHDLLDWAESYQNQIILKEEAIDLLKQDITAQEKRLVSEYLFEGQQLKDEIVKSQVQLRSQMNYMEDYFFTMKKAFNEYLAKKVLHE